MAKADDTEGPPAHGVRAWISDWGEEALFLAGAAVFLVGLFLVWPPLAWIVAGLMMMGIAYLLTRARDADERVGATDPEDVG